MRKSLDKSESGDVMRVMDSSNAMLSRITIFMILIISEKMSCSIVKLRTVCGR